LLDAPLCSWSECYDNSLAKSIGLALNSDNKLISWDGTYWKQKVNSSFFVKNHTVTGNSYTSIQKEALIPNGAIGWAKGSQYWYNTCSFVQGDWKHVYYRCNSFGGIPSIQVTDSYITNGVPSCSGLTWTGSNSYGNDFWMWNNKSKSSVDTKDGTKAYLRCVK